MNKISYTALSKYIDCPESFRLHYKEKLRPVKIGSPLLFGNAFDKAIVSLLKDRNLTNALNTFKQEWSVGKDNPLVEYRPNDLDADLLTESERTSDCPQWYSLLRKGEILIKQYETQILPNILEVLGTQIDIELTNPTGDSVIGKCDYVVKWSTGEIVAFDLKSSSIVYDRDSVKKSTQLAIYDTALKDQYKLDKCGYHVASKHIVKNKSKICVECGFDGSGTQFKTCNNKRNNSRCDGEWKVTMNPTGYIQVIIDNIDPIFKQSTIDNLNEINFAVKSGVYFKNFNNCITKIRRCEYFDLCHNNSLNGLVKKT